MRGVLHFKVRIAIRTPGRNGLLKALSPHSLVANVTRKLVRLGPAESDTYEARTAALRSPAEVPADPELSVEVWKDSRTQIG